MITLASDCLLFELASGESVPYSAEMVSVELEGDTAELFDAEFVRHAANAVFYYFKHELRRQTVSVGEFAGALEKLLRGFATTAQQSKAANSPTPGSACWSPICIGWLANPGRAASCCSSRACAPNCSDTCSKPRRCCVFAGCAAVSSN